jgi:uncharacterized integral membrane protein
LALVLQILLAVLLIAGLVTFGFAFKRWHWSLVLIVGFIMFSAVGWLFLAAETIRINRNLRANLANIESRTQQLENDNKNLINGSGDTLGIAQLTHKLEIHTRDRGRAWRQVAPAGALDQQGRRAVTIPAPTPHGLQVDTVVYGFEAGKPNLADPASGQQYLGEFRVVESTDTGVILESVNLLDQRTGERLARSQGPWNLYEIMPADRHSTFAGLEEAELRQRLPASVVEEFLRHGKEPTENDDPSNIVGFDAEDKQLPPGDLAGAARKEFHRPLVDYAFLFSELAKEKVVLMARIDAVREDNAKLAAALASAKKLSAFREDEKKLMASDLAGMKQDRAAIEKHLAAVKGMLENAVKLVDNLLAENSKLARELAEREAALVKMIDAVAPAPATASVLTP